MSQHHEPDRLHPDDDQVASAPRHGPGRPERTAIERAFMLLANGVTHQHPDELHELIARATTELGGGDLRLLLADLDQRLLRALADEDDEPFDVEGDGPGLAYRSELLVTEPVGEGKMRLWVPILDSAERLGVLGVLVDEGPIDSEMWTALASTVGESLVSKAAYGDGIQLTRRSAQVTLAAELRWTTLPPLTFTCPHIEISGILQPAYEIAGDTFDYAINHGVVSLAVLDAMGHGLEASRMANLAVGAYRRGRRQLLPLGDLLREIDEVVSEQFGDSRFVTGHLAQLDIASGRLEIINAGHPQPMLFRDGTDIGDLPCSPCPPMGLGMVDTDVTSVLLEPGDVVVLYTDGVTEARAPDGSELGRDALGRSLAEHIASGARPAEVLRLTMHEVARYSSHRFRDDATMLFVRWT